MLRLLNKLSVFSEGKKEKLNIRDKLKEQLKENKNLYEDIKRDHGLDLEDFIYILGDRDAFKQKFLEPHYKLYNILNEINEKIKDLRTQKLTEEELNKNLEYFEQKKLELAESKIEIL